MIRTSLTRKLIIVFSAILIAVVALNIVFNGLLISKVYRDKKITAMENLYYSLLNEYSTTADSATVIEIVKNTLSNENLRVFIWDKDNRLIIDSLPLSHDEEEKAPRREMNPEAFPQPQGFGNFKGGYRNPGFGRMEMFLFSTEISDEDMLLKREDYSIFSFDKYEEKTLCLRSSLPGEYKLLIQMPYAPIDEAVGISNTLLLIIGTIMLIIGIIIVAVTSRTIAKPVKELSLIAKAMEQLDFSKKYSGNRYDEIGSLGDSINSLSLKLESTINELCEKNNKLLYDIELKSRIDTMRKEFIANASHELKTPLALISGYAEGLRDNIAADEEARKLYADVIIEETEKMDHIILQMLDLMELDGSDKPLDAREISLTMIAQEALDSFDLILKNKNISVSFRFEGECIVHGDYLRIYQAVTNYISNAINHVDENKVIDITVKKTDDKATFSVYNSGVNISLEDQINIWERFYKIDKAHTREYGGSGLGLSIVRSVIELHQGEYGVKNHPDGVEFYFTLKCIEENDNEA